MHRALKKLVVAWFGEQLMTFVWSLITDDLITCRKYVTTEMVRSSPVPFFHDLIP